MRFSPPFSKELWLTEVRLTETTEGGSESFKWPVQTYDFELDDSNVFFLWLFEGSALQQGNTSASQMSSSFFNITTERDTTSSTSVESTQATAQPTTTRNSPEATDTDATTDLQPSETSVDDQQDLESSSVPTTTSTPSNDSGEESKANSAGELSVAAKAGIGAGVGVIGVTCISCTFLLWGYLRKKKASMAAPQEVGSNVAIGPNNWQTPPPYWKSYPLQEIQGSVYHGSQNSAPVELGSGRY